MNDPNDESLTVSPLSKLEGDLLQDEFDHGHREIGPAGPFGACQQRTWRSCWRVLIRLIGTDGRVSAVSQMSRNPQLIFV
jgi:hypothetical protein